MDYKVKNWVIKIDEKLVKISKEKLRKDLKRYFNGNKVRFDYKMDFSNFTKFQKEVLQQMKKIPYGKIITYSKLSEKAGYSKAWRATGNVCKLNPVPIVIPCHRVVSKNGLGGYSSGLDLKRYLLNLESKNS